MIEHNKVVLMVNHVKKYYSIYNESYQQLWKTLVSSICLETEVLEHSHQLSQMCQIPNIWHIWHTKHKNRPSSGVLNVSKFWDMLQYALKYESVWTEMPFQFNNFLFSFFSPLSSLSSFLFFLILPQSLRHQTSPTHFNHSFFFSLSLVFSLPLSLAAPPPRPDADLCCYEFFFFLSVCSDLIPGLAMGGLR